MFFLQKAFLFLDYEKIKLPIDCINTKIIRQTRNYLLSLADY